MFPQRCNVVKGSDSEKGDESDAFSTALEIMNPDVDNNDDERLGGGVNTRLTRSFRPQRKSFISKNENKLTSGLKKMVQGKQRLDSAS